jgi:gluconolactonase
MKSSLFTSLLIAFAFVAGQSLAQETIEPTGPVELVKDGFQFTEGPASDSSGTLYFSDIPATTIQRLSVDGKMEVFTTDSKFNNGLIFTADGRLLGCQMAGSVVEYDLSSGKVAKVFADVFEGKRFNAPNDLIIDKVGGIYFTDPLFRAPEPLPQGIQAVYYVDKELRVNRLTEALAAPNGIALSPAGDRLYVIPSMQAQMLVYKVIGPGKISGPEVLCTLRQPAGKTDTGGDGMAVDAEGNLYITTHIGVQIFSAAGAAIGIIETPQQPANVAFGGADRKTLYITARTGLYKVPMPIAGLAPN